MYFGVSCNMLSIFDKTFICVLQLACGHSCWFQCLQDYILEIFNAPRNDLSASLLNRNISVLDILALQWQLQNSFNYDLKIPFPFYHISPGMDSGQGGNCTYSYNLHIVLLTSTEQLHLVILYSKWLFGIVLGKHFYIT